MNPRALTFISVGVSGFIIQMAVLFFLTAVGHWRSVPATAVAVEAAVLTNFVWHDRLTWRDRHGGATGRWARLWKFHVTNGFTSILGNVLVTAASVTVLGVNAPVANIVAVVLLSALNYMSADRWVFARRAGSTAAVAFLIGSAQAHATELKPETIAAWNRHVASVEDTLPRHENDAPLAEPQGLTIEVPGGVIHEWRGSILVRGVTVPQLIDGLLSPGLQPLQEDVAESRVLERHGDSLTVSLKLVRKVIVTVTYDTEHDVRYVRRSPTFATSRSVATKIVEDGGSDRGFLWRLNSYWRYRQVPDGVQVDVLSLSLSRDIPWMVKPIAQSFIDRIGRESMARTLVTVQRTADALLRRSAVTAARTSG